MILVKEADIERIERFLQQVECIEYQHQQEASNLLARLQMARRGYPTPTEGSRG